MPTMRAQVLTAPGRLEYQTMDAPACGPDQILVRLQTACLCNGSDPLLVRAEPPTALPQVFGHEPFGVVVECGSAVQGLQPGDRVSWWFSVGAFAEYVAVTPNDIAVGRLPESIPAREAPLIELAAAAGRAVHAVPVGPGSRVLIVGLGPSGLLMCQQAKAMGAGLVVGWDLYPMRREKGLALACDAVYDPLAERLVETVRADVGELDIAIDAMGNDQTPGEPTLDQAVQALRRGGEVVLYGHPSRGRRFDSRRFQSRSAVMRSPVQDMDRVRQIMDEQVALAASGRLNLGALITHEIPLSEVPRGMELITEHPGECIKVIVRIAD